MVRTAGAALLMTWLVAVSASGQSHEECMDCAEREIRTWVVDLGDGRSQEWKEIEALCADCPCEGTPAWVVVDEDAGAGCRVYPANAWAFRTGTECNSVETDARCPPTDPPPSEGDEDDTCTDPPCETSPILLDLGGDNYRLTSVANGVQFDLRNEGRRRPVAWTRAGVENAFIALDRDGNGRIDNGSELFGNVTPLRSGLLAPNGFIALAEMDENRDGLVDARDAAWSILLLWTDRNHDGWSTEEELQPIAASAVIALETSYQTIGRKDQWGNLYRYRSQFRVSQNGIEHQRSCYDVYFRIYR